MVCRAFDTVTNQTLDRLVNTNGLVEYLEIELANGKTYPVYLLNSYGWIIRLKGRKSRFAYKYNIFYQKGVKGAIREWTSK